MPYLALLMLSTDSNVITPHSISTIFTPKFKFRQLSCINRDEILS